MPGGTLSGLTGTGTPTLGLWPGTFVPPAGGGGALVSGGGGGGAVHGRIDCASVTASAFGTGLLAVPSQTTNHRSGARWPRGVPGGVGAPTTPAQIWPLGLVVSGNFTSSYDAPPAMPP